MCDVYGLTFCTSISRITDRLADCVIARQNRPLGKVYLIGWIYGIVFKIRENSDVINKTIYPSVSMNTDGNKEILGT